jgi:hypothetical protein
MPFWEVDGHQAHEKIPYIPLSTTKVQYRTQEPQSVESSLNLYFFTMHLNIIS